MTEKLKRKITHYQGQYRITVPKAIIQMLSIKEGDEMVFLIEHGDVVMRKNG